MSKITGRVIDYDNDSPIQGVLIQGIAKNGTIFNSTNTNAMGQFVFDDPGLDDLYSQVRFSADGYATQTMRPSSANNVDVVLPKAGTLATVTLAVKRNPMKALLFVALGALAVFLYFKYKNKL